jgi:phosphoribosylamine---glycine ligase
MSDSRLRILVLGSGAREHALGTRLAASARVREVLVAPGNGGTERELENRPLSSLDDPAAIVSLAREVSPDLVVIGPEAPLVHGAADALRESGFLVFGPGKKGAQLEGSKAFFKEFAQRHGLPTARFAVFTDAREAHAYVDRCDHDLVVKADGLCAGKGVVVAADKTEAHAAIDDMLGQRVFGDAGGTIVLEEQLRGEEASVHILTDGKGFVVLPAAQDHKRIFDGDRGPNTGGMGAYAPAPVVSDAVQRKVIDRIVKPTVRGLFEDGIDYRGVLFAGLMISSEGEPMILEYNARFGDPETEVLMAVIEDDVLELLLATARGEIGRATTASADGHAVAVVHAAAGYPQRPRTGDVITGLERANEVDGVYVLHAGTRREGDAIVSAGGRVLAVTAHAATLEEAVQRAYEASDAITFDGRQMRRDIAHRALSRGT